jgi:acetyltransferase
MPSYGASGNPVDVTAQGSNTGPALMTVMKHLAESDELDMLVLVSSVSNEIHMSLEGDRIEAVAAKCGKPMTAWSYTIPPTFGRDKSAGCGLFLHTNQTQMSASRCASWWAPARALQRPLRGTVQTSVGLAVSRTA